MELAEKHTPDLVLLDIGLPDINGLEVLRTLRSVSDVPVAMLTVRLEDVEIARFLDEGADEYIVKPFSHVELMGRIQAIFCRAQGRTRSDTRPLEVEDLLMDFDAHEMYKAGEPIPLTRTERRLLEVLVRNATRVVTYDSLSSDVLQVVECTDAEKQLIKAHMQRVRSKLGDSAENPKYVANIYGVGYKFLLPVTYAGVGIVGANGR